jgi:hypothetical protein
VNLVMGVGLKYLCGVRGTWLGSGVEGGALGNMATTLLGAASAIGCWRARDGGEVGVGCFENATRSWGCVKGSLLLAGWPWEKG